MDGQDETYAEEDGNLKNAHLIMAAAGLRLSKF